MLVRHDVFCVSFMFAQVGNNAAVQCGVVSGWGLDGGFRALGAWVAWWAKRTLAFGV